MSVGKRLILEKAKNAALTARMDEMRAEQAVKLATENVRIADLEAELAALRSAPAVPIPVKISDKLKMSREQQKAESLTPPSGAQISWEQAAPTQAGGEGVERKE